MHSDVILELDSAMELVWLIIVDGTMISLVV